MTQAVCRLLLLACLTSSLSPAVHAACGSIRRVGGGRHSGRVTSHSTFGRSNYLPGMNCQWVVTLPSSSTYVSVTVSSLSLGEGDCIRVLRHSDNVELTSVCDGTATGTLITLTSQGIIRFTSDSSGQAAGFRLTLSLTKSSDCTGYKYMYSSSGSISSHSGVGLSDYGNSMRCYWHIRVPPGKVVRATFTTASLETQLDGVRLLDGPSVGSAGIADVTGSVAPSSAYESTGRYMTVYFYTDYAVSRAGFQMKFDTLEIAVCRGPVPTVWIVAAVGVATFAIATLVGCVVFCLCCRKVKSSTPSPPAVPVAVPVAIPAVVPPVQYSQQDSSTPSLKFLAPPPSYSQAAAASTSVFGVNDNSGSGWRRDSRCYDNLAIS